MRGADRRVQLELFAGEAVAYAGPDANQMREFLHDILAVARAAETPPWPPSKVRLYRLMFPQLSFWLPADEAAQLRFEFEAELARLEAA